MPRDLWKWPCANVKASKTSSNRPVYGIFGDERQRLQAEMTRIQYIVGRLRVDDSASFWSRSCTKAESKTRLVELPSLLKSTVFERDDVIGDAEINVEQIQLQLPEQERHKSSRLTLDQKAWKDIVDVDPSCAFAGMNCRHFVSLEC
jgi:hypothetical protein